MKQFKIGEQTINRIGYGTMRSTTGPGIWGDSPSRDQAIELIRFAVEQGVNFIDTADSYGPYTSELTVAEALAPFGNQVMLATKGGAIKYKPGAIMANGHPYYLQSALEGSLRRLKRDSIDLYFLHRVDPNIPIEDSVGALSKLKEEGKIKNIGISNVSLDQYRKAKSITHIAAVQNAFNSDDRRHLELQKETEKDNVAFIAHTPVSKGSIQNIIPDGKMTPSQLSLRWILEEGENTIVIPGTSKKKHLIENLSSITL